MGTLKAETYDVAMLLNDPSLVGMRITGINVPLNTAATVTDCKAWLTKQLALESGSNIPDITSIDFTPNGNWVEVTFAEPYTITEEGVYAGYSLTVPSVDADNANDPNKVPIMCVASEDIGNLYIHTSRSVRKWRNLPETAYYGTGAYAMIVRLSGEHIKTHAASLLAPDERECFGMINTERPLNLTVVNHGLSEITNIDYEILFDNEKIEHNVDISLRGLYYGAKTNLNIELPAITNKGIQPVDVRITKVNGVRNEDGTPNVSFNICYLNEYPKHKPLMETYTGAWCGWCVREHASMNAMCELYGDDFVGISYHNGDAMECTLTYPNDVEGYPDCFIDRVQKTECFWGSSHQSLGIKEDWNARRTIIPPASISLEAHWTDESLTHLQVTSTTTFIRDFTNSPYQLTYILTEDNMSGSGSEWTQENSYANMTDVANDPYLGPYTNMPYSISGLEFNNVAVQLASSRALALDNTLPTTISAETQYNHTYTFDITQNDLVQDQRNLRPVVLLIDKSTGEVVNAEKVSVDITNIIPSKYTLEVYGDVGIDMYESHLYDQDGNEYDYIASGNNEFDEDSYIRIAPFVSAALYIREIIVNGESVGTWTEDNAPIEYVIESLSENTTVEFKTYLRAQWRTLGCKTEGPGKVEMYKNGNLIGTASSPDNYFSDVFECGDIIKLVLVPDAGSTLTQFLGGEYSTDEALGENLLGEITDNAYSFTFNPDDIVNKYGYLVRFFKAIFDGPEPSTNNTLSAAAPTILTGKTAPLSLSLANEDDIIMTEFYMQLPEGITIEEDEDGYPKVTLNSERSNNHSLEVSRNSEGLYHFLVFSSRNYALKGHEGELFSMNLVCAEGVAAGTYQATVKNILLSDPNKNEITPSDFTFDVTVMDVAMGDANGDGRINGMDIVEMVDYIMERPSDTFVFAAADLTADQKVNGMDLVELVSLVMAQGAASPQLLSKGKGAQMPHYFDSGLTLTSHDDGSLTLGVEKSDAFILAQMIVEVDGEQLTDVTTDTKHEAVWRQIGENRYAVLAYSTKNRPFAANDELLKLYFANDANNIRVTDVMLASAEREERRFESVAYGSATGINSIGDSEWANGGSVYDLQGRKVMSTLPRKGIYIMNGKKVVRK